MPYDEQVFDAEDIQEINFAFYEPSEWLKIEPLQIPLQNLLFSAP